MGVMGVLTDIFGLFLSQATVTGDDPLSSPTNNPASIHTSNPAIVTLLSQLDPHIRARMDYATKLWDASGIAFEKSRSSKHTAKGMAGFYNELSKIERNYSQALGKLILIPEYNTQMESQELKSPLTSTLMRAWSAVKADISVRSRCHASFADTLTQRVEGPLGDLRKLLSWKIDGLKTGVNEAGEQLKKATETHTKLRMKFEKQQSELNIKGATAKLTPADVALTFDAATTAQLAEFKARNSFNRILADNLSKLQELELERLVATRRSLLAHRLAASEMDRAYLHGELETYQHIQSIDEVSEVREWVEANQSKNPCPWSSVKTALSDAIVPVVEVGAGSPPITPPAAIMVGATTLPGGSLTVTPTAPPSAPATPTQNNTIATYPTTSAVPPTHAKAPRAAAVGLRHTGPNMRRTPSPAPNANANGTVTGGSDPRTQRNPRGNSLVLSPEAVALVSANSPLIASLATAPLESGSALPPNIRLADLPFPTIGLPKRIEPLPEFVWMPLVKGLFPSEESATLPDISSLALSPQEYNRLVYEHLLLSTNLLNDITRPEHFDTLLHIIRVQLHIPQAEHELFLKVLNIEQGHLLNSPTHTLTEKEKQSTLRQPQPRTAQVASAGAQSEDVVPSEQRSHVSESMLYVHYRVSLLKSVKSSKFPNLPSYQRWFHRHLHAVWLAILWTMQTQVNQSKGGNGVSSISLSKFKHTLSLIQLIDFSLTSKIATKIFVFGDSVLSGDHQDMRQQLSELETILSSFPPPFTSIVISTSLQYPTLLLNKIYKHIVYMSCISGGDETGRPKQREQNETSSSSDSETEDEGIALHTSYLQVIAAMSSVRDQWKVAESYHQYTLLHLIMHLIYYQSLDFDGKLLDADGMLSSDGEQSLLPLLSYVTNALCGTLRPEVAALQSSLRIERIRPESLDDDEIRFLCFALRNIGYALSDFHKFPSGPVTICFEFYHDICRWLGLRDVEQRCETFLKISTTNFYQQLIPTEQTLMFIPPTTTTTTTSSTTNVPNPHEQPRRGSLGKSSSLKTPTKNDTNDGVSGPSYPSSSSSNNVASIHITPKKMHHWSLDEWKIYTKHVGTFIRDQIEDFYQSFSKSRSLKTIFGTVASSSNPKGEKSSDGNPFAADVDDGVVAPPRPNSAETCILQMMRCFQQDVNLLHADRLKTSSGIDETFLALVSTLVRLQNVLMDSDYHSFWSSPSIQQSLADIFPNLQHLCAQSLKKWLEVQRLKVEGIRQRCVSMDSWTPVDDDTGHHYSHSVKDLFNFLNTIHEGFWNHAKNVQGFGVSDAIPLLIEVFDSTLVAYGEQIVESAGLDVIPQILPSTDTKLKQAKEAPDTKDKAKAFMKGLFKKESKEKDLGGSNEKDEDLLPTTSPELIQKGLVIQTIQSLCVRISCIENAMENSVTLSHALHSHAQAFIKEFPLVTPVGVKSDQTGSNAISEKRWAAWHHYFHPPTRMPRPTATNVFENAVAQMHEQLETLGHGIGVSKVYVDWRHSWLTKLYLPMPLESTRIIGGGELEQRIEESMPIVHDCLTRHLFGIVARHIFTQLMSAIRYVVLYGRRSIQEEQSRHIIRGDVDGLASTFSKILTPTEIATARRDIDQLLQVMELPTDTLIEMYTSQKAPLPFPIMIRIIAARAGKNAGKLVDKVRGK